MQPIKFTRNRLVYLLLIFVVTGLGLASRRYPEILPNFVATYAGDTLWALLVFLLIGLIFPTLSPLKIAMIALSFAFAIELSQLYQAPWINEIRQYRIVALVLGRGFLWSDLLCYSVGVTTGLLIEICWNKMFSENIWT